MNRFKVCFGLVAGFVVMVGSRPVAADCNTWHTECIYVCTEYYPNGTDCKKTKKVCYNVCDDFDVNKSHALLPAQEPGKVRVVEQPDSALTVTGRLSRIVAFGGQTPGWMLEMDSPLFYGDKKFTDVEVDQHGNALDKLQQGKVQVKGRIDWRKGRERGMYPVLVAKSVTSIP